MRRVRQCKWSATGGTSDTASTYHHSVRTPHRIWAAALIGLAAASTAIPVVIAEGALHIRNRPTAAPFAAERLARIYEATWHPVSITAADGVRLAAWFFVPAEHNGGAVLLLHGVGDTRLGMTSHAEYLLRAGYAVLLPDSR